MSTIPTDDPVWATDANYPATPDAPWKSTPTKVEPLSGEQAAGFAPGQEPAAQYLNWWMNLVYLWLLYVKRPTNPVFDGTLSHLDAADHRSVAVNRVGLSGARVHRIATSWVDLSSFWTLSDSGSAVAQVLYAHINFGNVPALSLGVAANTEFAQGQTGFAFSTPIGTGVIHELDWEVDAADLVGTVGLTMQMGFIHDTASSTEDYVYVEKTSASANWFFKARGTAAANTPADTEVAATGVQRFRIEWLGSGRDGTQRARLLINGVQVGQFTTNLPDGDPMSIVFRLTSTGATTKTVFISPVEYQCRRVLSDDNV